MDTDGSISPWTIAIITDTTVVHINGETTSSIWPCLFCLPTYTYYMALHDFINKSFLAGTIGFPPVVAVINVIKTSVYAYVVTMVTIGLILSIVCLMFNVIFHDRK